MENASQKDFKDALETYNVSLHQFKPEEWKKVVIDHAQGTVTTFQHHKLK